MSLSYGKISNFTHKDSIHKFDSKSTSPKTKYKTGLQNSINKL